MRYCYLLLPLIASGCSTYAEKFDCEPGIGVSCQSLSTVNTMVERQELPIRKDLGSSQDSHQNDATEIWLNETSAPPAAFYIREGV
jgi:hypothetical protein